MCKTHLRGAAAMATLLATMAAPAGAAQVHLADVVPVPATRVDFEDLPAGLLPFLSYLHDGVRVTQIDGEANGIWTTSGLGNGRSWYPDGGDNGYTLLTQNDGSNFDAVSLLAGSGWLGPPQSIWFELADDGVVVLSGELPASWAGDRISFSGGDFDEVRLRAWATPIGQLQGCEPVPPNDRCNLLWIDDIALGPAALQVPEPASAALAALALLALRRRRVSREGSPRPAARAATAPAPHARCHAPGGSGRC